MYLDVKGEFSRHDGGMAVQPLTPERRRELTKTALVEAAADVFAKRGFEGASLEEIAEAAGFSRGAIYSNFGSKEDLMLAVVERYNETLVGAFSETLGRAADISQEEMTLEEASEMVANAKRAALAMFPDKELAYDLIYKPRLQRLLRERFRLQ